MTNVYKKTEFVANAAIIIAALLLSTALVKNTFLSTHNHGETGAQPTNTNDTIVGKNLVIPGVDLAQSDKTLIFALQPSCRFCTDSAPFYKRIAETNAVSKAQLVAVSPQSIGDTKAYLELLGVPIERIAQIKLNTIGVSGTPSLLLVNKSGSVTKAWVGRLSGVQEEEVLSSLQ